MTAIGHPARGLYAGWRDLRWSGLVLIATDPTGRDYSIGELTQLPRGYRAEVLTPTGVTYRTRDLVSEPDARRWCARVMQGAGMPRAEVPPQALRAAALVAEHPEAGLAAREVAPLLGTSPKGASMALYDAHAAGLVRRTGHRRASRYYPASQAVAPCPGCDRPLTFSDGSRQCTTCGRYWPSEPGGTPASQAVAEPLIRQPDVSESASSSQEGPASPVACTGCGTAGRLFAHPWGSECLACGRCTPNVPTTPTPSAEVPPVVGGPGPAPGGDGPGCPGLPLGDEAPTRGGTGRASTASTLATTEQPAPSGGRKADAGKPRWDLLPWAQVADVVAVLTYGAAEYGVGNWQRVPEARERYYAAAQRHLVSWWLGERLDPTSGLPHLAHAVSCLLFLGWFERGGR